jgi:hypothetical protein
LLILAAGWSLAVHAADAPPTLAQAVRLAADAAPRL